MLSPLTSHDDHYRCLLNEVATEINIERRDRSYPRVIKRKMSNFPAKRTHHRQRHRYSRPPHTAVTITPPSKPEHRKRPAKTG